MCCFDSYYLQKSTYMKTIILTVLNLGFWVSSYAHPEPDSLPARPTLFESLRTYHTEKAAATTTEYQTVEKYRWMKWMPSVGIGYNLQGAPVPTLSFSLGQVYANLNSKAQMASKTHAILRGSLLSFKTDSIDLEMLLQKVDILRGGIAYDETVAQVDSALWTILEGQYRNKDIGPTEYLTAKKQFLERQVLLHQRRREIAILELAVRKLAQY